MRAALLTAALLALACSSSKPPPGKPRLDGGAGVDGKAGAAGKAGAGGGAAGEAGADGAAGAAGGAADGGADATGGAAGGGAGASGADGGGAGTGGAAGAVAGTGESVLTRNKRETRDGFFIQPTLTQVMATKMAPDAAFQARFTGSMYASPLYAENGPGGKGAFFAAATNNNVYALDETTGAILWMHNIGSAPAKTGVACGNVMPVGIISTPVIDPVTRTIYVAGGIGVDFIERHEIHALSLDDGAERAGWPVNVSALKDPTGLAFNTPAQNQRSALSLVNGILYVAYGGHGGDCNVYHGWVIAVDAKDPTKTAAWATSGQGEAIWAAGGMASDGTGVFAVTGNRIGDSATHQDSEEVVHLTGMGQLDRATGVYFPASWRTMDQGDLDFGASSPVVLSLPGSTPSTLLAAVAKDGHFYLLNAASLGGMGGHLVDLTIATGLMNLRTALAAYTSTTGLHVVLNAVGGASCGPGIVSISITPGSPPSAKQAWCTPNNGGASPIATSTDGKNEPIVWNMNGSTLTAINADSGGFLYNGANGPCSVVHSYTSPIAVHGHIIAGADDHLCSWSPH